MPNNIKEDLLHCLDMIKDCCRIKEMKKKEVSDKRDQFAGYFSDHIHSFLFSCLKYHDGECTASSHCRVMHQRTEIYSHFILGMIFSKAMHVDFVYDSPSIKDLEWDGGDQCYRWNQHLRSCYWAASPQGLPCRRCLLEEYSNMPTTPPPGWGRFVYCIGNADVLQEAPKQRHIWLFCWIM